MRTIEPIAFERAKASQTVAKRDQVIRDHIIAILAENLGSELPALRFFTEPKKVLAELQLGRLIAGLEWPAPAFDVLPLPQIDTSATASVR